jgi:hypothetical protein
MGDHVCKIHIKNSGAIIVFITFFWSIWHVLVHLDYLDQQGDFLLRCVGIVIITFMAYVPYALLNYAIDRVTYPFFLLGCAVILVFIDVILRIATIFGLFESIGFFGIFLYSLFFIVSIIFANSLSWLYRILVNGKKREKSLFLLLKKFMNVIIRKRIL